MGAGPADPLWLPAASQVLAVPQTEILFDIRRAPCSTQVFRKTEHIESGPRVEIYAFLYKPPQCIIAKCVLDIDTSSHIECQ